MGFAGAEQAGTLVLVISALWAIMLWGLGLWWLAHGCLSLAVRAMSGNGLRFTSAYWGLTFPYGECLPVSSIVCLS